MQNWFSVDFQNNAFFHYGIHSNSQQYNNKVRDYSIYLTVWFLKTYVGVEGKLGFL